jgi:predicted acyltransferase (DUF342 family)
VHSLNSRTCDDRNACTGADTCAAGICGGTPLRCDDGNVCTDDSCDPTTGCLHTGNTASCDDADPGTVRDACNGAGTCQGHVVTGTYALLSWPVESEAHGAVNLGDHVLIRGNSCAESIRVGPYSQIEGDLVAWASGGRALMSGVGSRIGGDVVTGGGALLGLTQATVRGHVNRSGTTTALAECLAARHRATSRRAEWVALPATPGLVLDAVRLIDAADRRVPANGTLGAGQNVIEVTSLNLDAATTLTVVGSPATDAVIVHVRGAMILGRGARIAVDGLPAERLMFVVDGPVVLQPQASIAGSVFAAGRVRLGRASTVTGALLGTTIDLASFARVDLHPFVGW